MHNLPFTTFIGRFLYFSSSFHLLLLFLIIAGPIIHIAAAMFFFFPWVNWCHFDAFFSNTEKEFVFFNNDFPLLKVDVYLSLNISSHTCSSNTWKKNSFCVMLFMLFRLKILVEMRLMRTSPEALGWPRYLLFSLIMCLLLPDGLSWHSSLSLSASNCLCGSLNHNTVKLCFIFRGKII